MYKYILNGTYYYDGSANLTITHHKSPTKSKQIFYIAQATINRSRMWYTEKS